MRCSMLGLSVLLAILGTNVATAQDKAGCDRAPGAQARSSAEPSAKSPVDNGTPAEKQNPPGTTGWTGGTGGNHGTTPPGAKADAEKYRSPEARGLDLKMPDPPAKC